MRLSFALFCLLAFFPSLVANGPRYLVQLEDTEKALPLVALSARVEAHGFLVETTLDLIFLAEAGHPGVLQFPIPLCRVLRGLHDGRLING